MNKYKYQVSFTAHKFWTPEIRMAFLECKGHYQIPIQRTKYNNVDWGDRAVSIIVNTPERSLPEKLVVEWKIPKGGPIYRINTPINSKLLAFYWQQSTTPSLLQLIIGISPHGRVVMWVCCNYKSSVFTLVNAEKIEKKDNGLLPFNLFDKHMQQFSYRYLILFEHWNNDKGVWQKYIGEEVNPQFEHIEEALFDGTHDKVHDGRLMNYHEAGKPKKLSVKWHIKKSEYTAYFWFEDEEIYNIFDRFYGAHPETKTDFMIRIDSEKKKFELALYRYGLKEPQVIRESAYQLIVFKNKFEYFRSENYDQPRGAWIW